MTPDVLQILRCPITQKPLRPLAPMEVDNLNRRREQGLFHLDGSRVEFEISEALTAGEGAPVFPVADGILILLPALAVQSGGVPSPGPCRSDPAKDLVRNFYDSFGWKKQDGANYADSILFVDQRPVNQNYFHECERRLREKIPSSGQYLLDAASGPIPSRDKLELSEGYRRRVCVDFSLLALREAKEKLGNAGIYILGDVTNLPLRDNAVDAALSLHTIYHVPEGEQITAFQELRRVVKPGGTAVAVYSWGGRSPIMRLMTALKTALVRVPARLLGRGKKVQESEKSRADQPSLYFHAHPYSWFTPERFGFDFDLVCYKFMNRKFLENLIHERFGGKGILRGVTWFEDHFPRLAARLGEYPMIVMKKD